MEQAHDKRPPSDPPQFSLWICSHATFVLQVPLWPAIFEHLSEPNERKSPIYFPLYSKLFLESPYAALMNQLHHFKGLSLNWQPRALSRNIQ